MFIDMRVLLMIGWILSHTLYSQDINDSLIISNKVKSIRERRYELNAGERVSSELVGYKLYNSIGKLIEEYSSTDHFKYKYNTNGLLINKIELNKKHVDKIETTTFYEYDKQGRLIEETTYWTHFEGNDPIEYRYNQKGQLVSINYLNDKKEAYQSTNQLFYETGELYESRYEEKYNRSANTIKRFDKCGNLIYLFRNGELDSVQVNFEFLSLCEALSPNTGFSVDTLMVKDGNNESTQYILRDNYRKSIYSYDSLGILASLFQYQFLKNGEPISSKEMKYDKSGNLIDYKELNHWAECNYSNDIRVSRTHKQLEYFSNGLPYRISSKFSIDSMDFEEITEFEIEYYP